MIATPSLADDESDVLPQVALFDGRRQQALVSTPEEVRVGDWLRDWSALRQVDSVEYISAGGGPGVFIFRFRHQDGVPDLALGMSALTTPVDVWRARIDAPPSGESVSCPLSPGGGAFHTDE